MLGIHYLLPKVCGAYFVGKAGLCYVQKHYPSFYEERLHAHSAFFSKIWNRDMAMLEKRRSSASQ